MKTKKFLAIFAAFGLLMSSLVSVQAATISYEGEGLKDGALITLEYTEFNEDIQRAMVDVSIEIPETLKKVAKKDGVYNGMLMNQLAIDIPKVDGLVYDAEETDTYNSDIDGDFYGANGVITEYDDFIRVMFTNSAAANKGYSGDLGCIYTICYEVKDKSVEYEIDIDYALVVLYSFEDAATNTAVTNEYKYYIDNFDVTGAVVPVLEEEEEATLSSIAVNPSEIEVAGEGTYNLSTIVTTATYSDGTTDNTVVPTWSGEGVNGTTFTAPAAPAYGEEDLTITLTATYEGETATVTVTVPASTEAPAFSASATVLPSYYTADNAEFSRKQVSMLNRTATSLKLEFVDDSNEKATKEFNVELELPEISGGAAEIFEAWVMNAPDAWSIFVNGVKAEVAAQ